MYSEYIIAYEREFFNTKKIRICTAKNNVNENKEIFLKKHLTKKRIYGIIRFVNGASPSGKATDSDSVIT